MKMIEKWKYFCLECNKTFYAESGDEEYQKHSMHHIKRRTIQFEGFYWTMNKNGRLP